MVSNMKVIYSMEKLEIVGKSIFLAGPIPRDNYAISWKNEALKYFDKYEFSGTVLVPEMRDFLPKVDYMDEVEWDYEALNKCDLILFWMPRKRPHMLGLTSNVEFGFYINNKPIIYGRPDDADDINYLDWFYYKIKGKRPHSNLDELVRQSVKLLN